MDIGTAHKVHRDLNYNYYFIWKSEDNGNSQPRKKNGNGLRAYKSDRMEWEGSAFLLLFEEEEEREEKTHTHTRNK